MKYFMSILLFAMGSVGANAQSSPAKEAGFMVEARLSNFPGTQIYLTYGGFHNSKIDTTEVVNGKFGFTGKVGEPVPAMVFTPDYKVRFDLYIDNGSITIDGDAAADMESLRIDGPAVTKEFVAFNRIIMDNRKRVNELNAQAYEILKTGDTTGFNEMQKKVNFFYNKEFDIRKAYIANHPESYISARELYGFSNVKTVVEARRMYHDLNERIRTSAQGLVLLERLQILSSVQTGQSALPFVQQDPHGKEVSLDDYRGSYVLVEFWASWCGPCRAENPNLLKAFNQYKDKGFTILGVSLDNVKDAWVNAIEKDGMPWTQVSDLKGWNNEVAEKYGIKAVPANFLVGPDGKIIALNLRGESLQEKLKEIF